MMMTQLEKFLTFLNRPLTFSVNASFTKNVHKYLCQNIAIVFLQARTCWATPSSDPNDKKQYDFLISGYVHFWAKRIGQCVLNATRRHLSHFVLILTCFGICVYVVATVFPRSVMVSFACFFVNCLLDFCQLHVFIHDSTVFDLTKFWGASTG